MPAVSRPLLLTLLLVLASTATAQVRQAHGVELAQHVVQGEFGRTLTLRGTAVVDRRYLPFYLAALYLEPGPVEDATITGAMAPLRVAVHWLTPGLAADEVAAYWRQAFAAVAIDAEQTRRLAPAIERFAATAGAVKRGDHLIIDYSPDGGLRVSRNGEPAGQFAGLEFSRLLFAIWLGPGRDAEARERLLGRAPPSATGSPPTL